MTEAPFPSRTARRRLVAQEDGGSRGGSTVADVPGSDAVQQGPEGAGGDDGAAPGSGELTGGAWGGYILSGVAYAPDGDVLSASDSVNGNWAYQYGPLNRLVQATCSANCPGNQSSQGLQYSYDRFGNLWDRTATAGVGPPLEISFDNSNHIVGADYDASGDLTAEGTQTFTFDAEGRISSADNSNVKYVYDAFGHRVEKITPAGTFYFLHDLSGRPVTELNSSGQWVRGEVYASGKHLATYNNGVFFDYSDWLGTERVRATAAGDENDQCTSLPFGDSLACAGPGADPSPMRQDGGIRYANSLAGKAHDATTGLEHFPARYYTADLGRWLSPDWSASPAAVPYANFSNPQSLNLYGYTLDNPVTATDPEGHCFLFIFGKDCKKGAANTAALAATSTATTNPDTLVPTADEVLGRLAGFAVEASAARGIVTILALTIGQTGGDPALLAREKQEAGSGRKAAPKAPGRPTEADGYHSPKHGPGSRDEMVRNPNGPGKGYLDARGDVWVPTGEGPTAHGGPHWDVETPGGGYRNVYPRGTPNPAGQGQP